MKYSEANPGRIFILRLEDGDVLHETIERFALEQSISAAALIAVGGADSGSRLVVGPEDGRSRTIRPMEQILEGVHEMAGAGTLFPDAAGRPKLHMHVAAGRCASSKTGCARNGIRTWHVIEVILWELTDTAAQRIPDAATGFELLDPGALEMRDAGTGL